MTDVGEHKYAVAMVVHNGAQYLEGQLVSIATQSPSPCCVFVVDDSSTDKSRLIVCEVLKRSSTKLIWVEAECHGSASLYTRIARNFSAALRAAAQHEVILVADQDDVWLEGRIQRQAARIRAGALLTAGSAEIIDSQGQLTGTNIRETFPVPADWMSLSAESQMEVVLARPLVTGAAMAISPRLLAIGLPIPATWLHDRWLSLVAAASGGLDLCAGPELQYRVHSEQVVGLGRRKKSGVQGIAWNLAISCKKFFDLCFRLRNLAASEAIRSRLGGMSVARILMSRG